MKKQSQKQKQAKNGSSGGSRTRRTRTNPASALNGARSSGRKPSYPPAFPGASRRAIAQALGLTQETVTRVLNGAQRPSDVQVYELARELKVSQDLFLEELRQARFRRNQGFNK